MGKGYTAKISLFIDAPVLKVWEALTDPRKIKQYMFGAEAVSDWKQGSRIIFKGIWKDKPYEDRGTLLAVEPGKTLKYTHFSPLSGLPDTAENYHTITIGLSAAGTGTQLELAQDNNATEDEKNGSEENWKDMMNGLKKITEESLAGR
jgi:uncharacterized protein YndB with AHSA1/START domain